MKFFGGGEKDKPTRHVNYGDRALGLDNSNNLEDGVPRVYRDQQNARTSVDPILLEDAKFVAESREKEKGLHLFGGGGGKRKSVNPNLNANLQAMSSATPEDHTFKPGVFHPERKKSIIPSHVTIKVSHLGLDFHQHEINEQLKLLERKSRVFIKRHPIHATRFDIIDENGTKIFQLDDFTKDVQRTPMNYVLATADAKKQLLILQGSPGFLGLNGELVAYYPGSQPGDKELELIFGRCVQKTKHCSFRPLPVIQNAQGETTYELQDRNKYPSVLVTCRKCEASVYELIKPKGLPLIHGRIDERRLIIPLGAKSKINTASRRTITAGRPSMVEGLGMGARRFSVKSIKRIGSQDSNQSEHRLVPLLPGGGRKSTVISLHMDKRRSKNIVSGTKKEKVTHDSFCVGFGDTLTYQTRVLMIVAHLLVNDDYVRKTKVVTRFCFLNTVILIICLVVVAIIGLVLLAHFRN